MDTGKVLEELESGVKGVEKLVTPARARKVCERSRTAFATCYAAIAMRDRAGSRADMTRLKRAMDRALKALESPELPLSREADLQAVRDACENIRIRLVWVELYLAKGARALMAAIRASADADAEGAFDFSDEDNDAVDDGVRDVVDEVLTVIVNRERARRKQAHA